MSIFSKILCIFTIGCLVACGSLPRPTKDTVQLSSLKQAFVQQDNAEYDAVLENMLRRMELEVAKASNPQNVTFDILVIHGGGAAGGFASGFLKGWGKIQDPEYTRPEFDYVTGASSGALLAPLAFIGDRESYQRAYEIAYEPPIFEEPGFFSLWPTRSSIISNANLMEGINSVFDAEVLQQIIRGSLQHRSLLIGATDLELGMGRVWDLTLEVGNLSQVLALERMQQVLLASTAIPGYFPPVEIDGHLYTDGGVAATLFLGMDDNGVGWVAKQWQQRHPDVPMPTLRIWVIVNAKMFVDKQTVQPRYLEIAMRSINIAMSYDRLKALYMLAFQVDEMDEMEGVHTEFRYVFIPDEATVPVDVTQLGDKEIIRNLVDLGYKQGSDPDSWTHGPPQVHRLQEPKISEESKEQ